MASIARFFQFLPGEQRQAFVEQITEKASGTGFRSRVLACASRPSCMKTCASRCYAGTDGDAKVAARCRISRFTIGNCVASPGMMQSKTSLRFALHATQSFIGKLIEDCFLTGPGTDRLSNLLSHRCAFSAWLQPGEGSHFTTWRSGSRASDPQKSR
jgi:hypothetical protein